MQKATLSTFLLTFLISTLNAQKSDDNRTDFKTDTIEIRKVFGGSQFYYAGKQMNMKQLRNLLKSDEQAYKQFQSSKSSRTIATILGYAGGFLIGWPLGTAIAGGKPNWALAGVGAGITAISIPVGISSARKLKKAVSTYNLTL